MNIAVEDTVTTVQSGRITITADGTIRMVELKGRPRIATPLEEEAFLRVLAGILRRVASNNEDDSLTSEEQGG